MRRALLVLIGLLFAGSAFAAKILFIGNSFTYGAGSPVQTYRANSVHDLNGEGMGGLPALFKTFTEEAGLNYEVSLETHPGIGLDWHLANRSQAIASQPWDTVVMHGYSTLDEAHPGDPRLLVQTTQTMAALLRKQNADVRLHLLATWPRADQVYPGNGAWHGKSLEAMTDDLRSAYELAAAAVPGMQATAPVGSAWLRAIQAGVAVRNPYEPQPAGQMVKLWGDDNYHASVYGSYLEALVVFGTVTGRDPRSLGVSERAGKELGLSSGQMASLQQVAFEQLGAAVEARVADLLQRLSPDEKLALIGGDKEFYIREVPRLKLPRIRMADGPIGVRNDTRSTAYPASVALAASWDQELAREFGTALGRDARARGVHVQLGPAVNIQRVPINGRNFEYLSEDPLLAARLGVPIVQGMQSQGVVATVKHYAANNQENDRMTIDARVGERALREIYLPAFEAAVRQGGAWAVMSAYNRLNGDYATANKWLNLQVLKKEWAFSGVLMSDWDATHDTLGAASGGLDLEMPAGVYMNAKALKELLSTGQITQADIDDKVRRILRMEIAMGFLDRPQQDASIPLDDPRSAAVALKMAQEGVVLLRNEQGLLPLQAGKLKKFVVIGPTGDAVAAGGGSSTVAPIHSTSLAAALKRAVGDVHYIGGTGLNPAERLIRDARYEGPLKRELFDGMELQGPAVETTQVGRVWEDWSGHAPAKGLGTERFSARWTGRIKVPKTGDYRFVVQSDDGSRVFLDDQLILDFWSDHGLASKLATVHLQGGTTHKLRVEYMQNGGDAAMRFGWGPGNDAPALSAKDKAAIRAADAVVVAAGYNLEDESEGSDRSFELPYGQAQMIQTVAALNPRTVVVLNSGGPVATDNWLAKVPALLHAWFPGQDGNRAVADILFGKLNPSGKLPFTFEKRLEDSAPYAQAPRSYPGVDGKVDYSEGILVGYRWADSKSIEPLFPFGFGLSYTRFEYSAPELHRDAAGRQVLSFKITNTGKVAGAEVAQVYVEAPASAVPRPVRELKGFARLELRPGQSGEAKITLDERAFAYFDEASHAWKTEAGRYKLVIGASSRDLRLHMTVDVEAHSAE